MQGLLFNREKTGLFTDISNRLSYNQTSLLPYIHLPFSKEAFAQQIETKAKSFTSNQRQILVDVLQEQYKELPVSSLTRANIDALSNSQTYTVATGHQLSLFTGPTYFIYKILHTIRLAEELNTTYPQQHFVPLFWMASEDHDFEEVQAVNLFNQTIRWESTQKGAVGRFNTIDLEEIKTEFAQLFTNQSGDEIKEVLHQYTGKTYGEATLRLVNHLFSSYGLVVLDGDNAALKRSFAPIIEKEIREGFSFKAVTQTSENLQQEGVKLQVTPREINLFYLADQVRSRIQVQGEEYFIEGIGNFTQEKLLNELEQNPQAFSPNVVLRPLYQESVLPNLCYLGGGGEMAYWLQLKGVFEAVNCPYPLIQVRNSLLLVDANSMNKIDKLDFTIADLFDDLSILKKNYVLKHSAEELHFENVENALQKLAFEMKDQATKTDKQLDKYVEAEITRLQKQVEAFQQKLIKTAKGKHEQSLLQIEQIKNRLFPNGGMQERSINFFSLCSNGQVSSQLNNIYQLIAPFENDLIVQVAATTTQ